MILPERLSPGDLVRVIAPASPFDRTAFEKGLAVLQSMGFRTRFREDLFERSGFLAGADSRRVAEIEEAFADPSARGVWCARGGYGSPRVLARLPFARLVEAPKVLVGFSDPTVLLNALVAAGMVAFHGPNVTGLGGRALSEEERRLLLTAVGQAEPLGLVARGKVLASGRAEGRLLGGNLAMLGSLMGTPYAPDWQGAILCLEDVGEKPFRIDRVLTQLRLAGVLEAVAGVALGRFSRCEAPEAAAGPGEVEGGVDTVEKVLERNLGALGRPVLAGLPFGHDGENRVLPLGVRARIEEDRLEVLEPAVR